jgi:sirohydrochlorin cobaltochelatase
MQRALVLVGHGGVPKDMPRKWVREMKQFARKAGEGDERAAAAANELDRRIRTFPRTDETDPYGAGIRRLADRLRPRLEGWRVVVAYNELCAPSIEEAIGELVRGGATDIRVITTMITPGGAHSEVDIPEALERARAAHPEVDIVFVWPLDLDRVAAMFAGHVAG